MHSKEETSTELFFVLVCMYICMLKGKDKVIPVL